MGRYDVTAFLVLLAHDIEKEGICVVVDGLMLDEELGQQAQILTVQNLLVPVHFVHEELPVAIDLGPRRVGGGTNQCVTIQVGGCPIVLQTELADVQLGHLEGLRVRGVVPAADLVAAELDALYPLDLVITPFVHRCLCYVHLILFQR